jgi:hypothetical protein
LYESFFPKTGGWPEKITSFPIAETRLRGVQRQYRLALKKLLRESMPLLLSFSSLTFLPDGFIIKDEGRRPLPPPPPC